MKWKDSMSEDSIARVNAVVAGSAAARYYEL